MADLRKIGGGDINTSVKQLLICFLIDSSYSMRLENRMDQVNEGIHSFLNSARNNPFVKDRMRVCVITYGGTAQIIQPFMNVKNLVFKGIKPNGGTVLNAGLQLALDSIKREYNRLATMGSEQYIPWLIVMSDGGSDDDVSQSVIELKKMYEERDLKGKCIGIGEEIDEKILKKIAPNGNVKRMDSMQISNFFSLMSEKAIDKSMSVADVEDDNPEIPD